MEKKFDMGISFCYPEGEITKLGKFVSKVAMHGIPAGNLVVEGSLALAKSILGGIPVQVVLTVNSNEFIITPAKFAEYIVDGINEIRVPRNEILSVDKKFNYLLMQHLVTVRLSNTQITFVIHPMWGNAGNIKDALSK